MAARRATWTDAADVVQMCYREGWEVAARRIVLECVREGCREDVVPCGRWILKLANLDLEGLAIWRPMSEALHMANVDMPNSLASFALWACYHAGHPGRMHGHYALLHALSHAATRGEFPIRYVAMDNTLNRTGISSEQLLRWNAELRLHAQIAMDIFPLHFRQNRSVVEALSAARLANHTTQTATTIFIDEDWASMPVLADMLEDDGVRDVTLLQHLRAEALHRRGCWAIEAVRDRA